MSWDNATNASATAPQYLTNTAARQVAAEALVVVYLVLLSFYTIVYLIVAFHDQGHTPFLDCGGYSRWEQQVDGCRGTRAARRVENLGQGRGETRAALRRVGFSAEELDTVARWLSADSGAASAFLLMLGARRVPDAF